MLSFEDRLLMSLMSKPKPLRLTDRKRREALEALDRLEAEADRRRSELSTEESKSSSYR